MSLATDRHGRSDPGWLGPEAALRWYQRLVVAAFVYSSLVVLLSVGSLIARLGKPHGGFLWSWDHSNGVYRVDTFSPEGTDTLHPADTILEVEGQADGPAEIYRVAHEHYESAASVCSDAPPTEPPVVRYRVLRRGEELETEVPIRCFRVGTLLRVAAIPVVLALLIWLIGVAVYRAGPGNELNLVFAFCTAWATNAIVMENACGADLPTLYGRLSYMAVITPSPILAAATLYHLIAILPRQHPSRRLYRTRWLWYLLIPVALIILGTVRFLLGAEWRPLAGLFDAAVWWGIFLYLAGVPVAVLVRYWRIHRTTTSRQARNQVQLIGLSMLMVFGAIPFVVAQREPHLVTWVPISQPALLFWLVPVFVVIAFAILRFQVFPGRVRGLNFLSGLAVTVIVALVASPIPLLDPELGFVALLAVLAAVGMFWSIPNPVLRVVRRFTSPGTIERAAIERFGGDIQGILDLETLPTAIVQSLEQQLKLRFAALWLVREPGVLTLEVYTDRAPAADLPDQVAISEVWENRPTRVRSGPLAAAQCEILLPLAAGGRPVGIVGLGERWTEEVFDETDLVALGVMADQAALTLGTARQIRALGAVPLQLEQAQLKERDRIAQDLHDSTQAQLTQLSFAMERVRGQLYTDPARGEELLDDCIRDVNQAARDLRAILRDLIPRHLLGQTFLSALQEYVDSAQALHETVDISVQADSAIESLLSADKRMALLRICQQALDNALSHADARSICITLQMGGDREVVEFSIVDDGHGFAPRPTGEFIERGHHGLYIVQSRALQHGGQVQVESTPGQGTVVKGYLPGDK